MSKKLSITALRDGVVAFETAWSINRARWEPALKVARPGGHSDAFVVGGYTVEPTGRAVASVVVTPVDDRENYEYFTAAAWAARQPVRVLRFMYDGHTCTLTSEGRLTIGCTTTTLDGWDEYRVYGREARHRARLMPFVRARLAEVNFPAATPAPVAA